MSTRFNYENTKEKQGHIKSPYLELLLILSKKPISTFIVHGNVIFYT